MTELHSVFFPASLKGTPRSTNGRGLWRKWGGHYKHSPLEYRQDRYQKVSLSQPALSEICATTVETNFYISPPFWGPAQQFSKEQDAIPFSVLCSTYWFGAFLSPFFWKWKSRTLYLDTEMFQMRNHILKDIWHEDPTPVTWKPTWVEQILHSGSGMYLHVAMLTPNLKQNHREMSLKTHWNHSGVAKYQNSRKYNCPLSSYRKYRQKSRKTALCGCECFL